ncbi:hypothetical protein FRB99_007437, partial [Tulasnella sp. 403]
MAPALTFSSSSGTSTSDLPCFDNLEITFPTPGERVIPLPHYEEEEAKTISCGLEQVLQSSTSIPWMVASGLQTDTPTGANSKESGSPFSPGKSKMGLPSRPDFKMAAYNPKASAKTNAKSLADVTGAKQPYGVDSTQVEDSPSSPVKETQAAKSPSRPSRASHAKTPLSAMFPATPPRFPAFDLSRKVVQAFKFAKGEDPESGSKEG